jgi:hypothetical protein
VEHFELSCVPLTNCRGIAAYEITAQNEATQERHFTVALEGSDFMTVEAIRRRRGRPDIILTGKKSNFRARIFDAEWLDAGRGRSAKTLISRALGKLENHQQIRKVKSK